jgi:superfamily II DNA or RNA helicase
MGVAMEYADFLKSKALRSVPSGLTEIPPLNPALFPFQADLVRWALRRGKAAVFAATGLGKTRIELTWSDIIKKETGGDVLVLAPLAVAAQTAAEAGRVGVKAKIVRDGSEVEPGISVTNYERLHRFDVSRFVAVVIDESSSIKHADSRTFIQLCELFRDTPFKLAATATPAPNDYVELGTHAEWLGIRTKTEMLSEYFTHDSGDTSKWRLKGHARGAFWKWVANWGAMVRKPSDLGYSDDAYDLPPLNTRVHIVQGDAEESKRRGLLFPMEAQTLTEQRTAKRASIDNRVRLCAEVVRREPDEPWIIWTELNAEGDALRALLPEAIEIRGSDDIDTKEQRLLDFSEGRARVVVTKGSIAGWGLNWQHCARMAFVGVTHSWESYFQSIRRCWRFNQRRPVDVHIFASEAEGAVLRSLERKERDAVAMADALSAETRAVVLAEVRGLVREKDSYSERNVGAAPAWLRSAP